LWDLVRSLSSGGSYSPSDFPTDLPIPHIPCHNPHMRKLTAVLCLTLAVLLGSGSANASEHCEDTSDPRYDEADCEGQGKGWSAGHRGACDRLAEHPSDKNKLTEGVRWFDLIPDEARRACRKAIREHPDDPKIQFQLGRALAKGGKYEEAFEWYRLAVEQENTNVQTNLGYMYQKGLGVPQNDKTAIKWYRLAVEQGEVNAQLIMGFMYREGKGVWADYETALKWFRLVEKHERAAAQYALGAMYHKGQGVPRHYKTAEKWYKLAIEPRSESTQIFSNSFNVAVQAQAKNNIRILKKDIAKLKK